MCINAFSRFTLWVIYELNIDLDSTNALIKFQNKKLLQMHPNKVISKLSLVYWKHKCFHLFFDDFLQSDYFFPDFQKFSSAVDMHDNMQRNQTRRRSVWSK